MFVHGCGGQRPCLVGDAMGLLAKHGLGVRDGVVRPCIVRAGALVERPLAGAVLGLVRYVVVSVFRILLCQL